MAQIVDVGIYFANVITLLSDNTVVVWGEQHDGYSLISYSLQTREKLSHTYLNDVRDIAAVKLGNKSAVAVSFLKYEKYVTQSEIQSKILLGISL